MRYRSMGYVALLFTSVFRVSPALANITVRPESPTPVVQTLRAIAAGRIDATFVANILHYCTANPVGKAPGCGPELEDVLSEFSRVGVQEREMVFQGLNGAIKVASPKNSQGLKDLQGRLQMGKHGLASTQAPFPSFPKASANAGPPGREDIGRLPQPIFDGRLFAYVESLLADAPEVRVRQAFESGVATSCETIYEGQAIKVCSEVGLWNLQRASLWVAVKDLRDSRGDLRVIDRYLAARGKSLIVSA